MTNKQTRRIEGETIELEFGGGPGDLTTGHEAIVQHDSIVIEFNEPLQWHLEHHAETMQALGWNHAGRLSGDDVAALRAVIAEDRTAALPIERIGFDLVDSNDDDETQSLVFSMTFGPESLGWDDETVHHKAWPFIATLANMVDPGTFGSQYLFTAVERHQKNEVLGGGFNG